MITSGARDVLVVGTTETSLAVGLGLDLRLLSARGIRAWSVVTAVSAQDAGGVRDLEALSERSVRAQFAAVDPAAIGAIRIGALPSAEIVLAVDVELERFPFAPLVLDPVLRSSRGGALTHGATVDALRRLVRHATIVTPNLAEASALTGYAVDDESGMVRAARAIQALGAHGVLATGGHLLGDPVDVWCDRDGEPARFTAARIPRDMRGTGCVLAVSLAAELAAGHERDPETSELVRVIERARATVRTTIAHAVRVGGQWVSS